MVALRANAQDAPTPLNAADPADVAIGLEPTVVQSIPRFYGSAEYLLWWSKPVCLKPSTLTVGNPGDAAPGAFGQPGTQVIQGGSKFEFSAMSGGRATIGYWLSDDDSLAFEATGFLLEQGRASVTFNSNSGSGSPATYIPYRTPSEQAQALPFSVPGQVEGSSEAVGRTWLWGTEANLVAGITVERTKMNVRGDFLLGFRYLNLRDKVDVANRLWLLNDPSQFAYGAANFTTHTQFWGGQIGSRFTFERGNWAFMVGSKVAIGESHQVREITGSPILATSGNNGLLPGPVLALSSNIGRQTSSRIAVVPEAQVKLRYRFSEAIALSVGYNALYWNRVLCPGDQMDGHLNPTQLPGRGPATGPGAPAPQFVQTDYFAQGFDFGIEWRY